MVPSWAWQHFRCPKLVLSRACQYCKCPKVVLSRACQYYRCPKLVLSWACQHFRCPKLVLSWACQHFRCPKQVLSWACHRPGLAIIPLWISKTICPGRVSTACVPGVPWFWWDYTPTRGMICVCSAHRRYNGIHLVNCPKENEPTWKFNIHYHALE